MEKHSFDYILSRSLMRSRLLIDLVDRCIGVAVNREHVTVASEDIRSACYAFSLDLISELGFELRDVSAVSEDIFYYFIGISDRLPRSEVSRLLVSNGVPEPRVGRIFDLLVWFSFLGLVGNDGEEYYIYHYRYDWRRMRTELARLNADETRYCVNSAFLDGLKSRVG